MDRKKTSNDQESILSWLLKIDSRKLSHGKNIYKFNEKNSCTLHVIRPDLRSSPYQVHHGRHQLSTHSRPTSPKLGDEEGRREVPGWPVLPPRMAGTTAQAAIPPTSPAALPPPNASPCQRYYRPASRGTTVPVVVPPRLQRYYRPHQIRIDISPPMSHLRLHFPLCYSLMYPFVA